MKPEAENAAMREQLAAAQKDVEEERALSIYRAIKMLPEKEKLFMEQWVHERAAIEKEKAE